MKKLLLSFLVLIIFSFIFIPNTYAINYYSSVNIKTAFSEDVDIERIEWIEVHLEDSTEYSKEYYLEKDKNFTLSLENVPVGPYNFRYGVVNDDQIGYYKVSSDIVINEETNIVDVTILVTLQNNETHTKVTLNNDEVSNIVGNNTTNNNNNSAVNEDEENEVIIGDDEEENSEQTANDEEKLTDYIVQEREKEQLEIEKAKKRKRNSLIGKILFSIIGLVLLIGGLFVAYKISVANK
ncbi:MAG: hypothetical protein J1F35_06980 [Erysipelotrichales bacterium]|nr:hypothetical protein [Erysipelotrichales bacterium]